jgi:hypothetical protein
MKTSKTVLNVLNSKNFLTVLTVLFSVTLPRLTHAATLTELSAAGAPQISVDQVSALARAAIQQETRSLNQALSGAESEDYYESQLEAIRRAGANRLADDYLFDKCTYTQDNLLSMMDDQLTLADDAAAGKGTALSRIQGLYGKQLWRAISQACSNSEARFQARLRALTAQGKSVALDDETVDSLTTLLFYPTRIGRPNFRSRIRAVVGTIFTAAVFIGSSSSLIGLPIGKVILSFAIPGNSFMGLRSQIGGQSIPLRPDAHLLLDLNADEHRFVIP